MKNIYTDEIHLFRVLKGIQFSWNGLYTKKSQTTATLNETGKTSPFGAGMTVMVTPKAAKKIVQFEKRHGIN